MSNQIRPQSASYLWRWYTRYLDKILIPSFGLDDLWQTLQGDNNKIDNIINNIQKIFMPTNNSNSNIQNGGGLFRQTDYHMKIFHDYRINSYKNLLNYLNNNDIYIDTISRNMLRKLYLYHYELDYVKCLNYILFKMKDVKLPSGLRDILSDSFTKISIHINNNLLTLI